MFLTVAFVAVAALAQAPSSQAAKPAPLPKPPNASTGGASQVSYSSATLNATIDPHGTETSYYFQYGSTAAYGAQTPTTPAGAGTVAIPVSQSISGLQPGSEYHYRVVAASAAGTTMGRDRILTTKHVRLKFEVAKAPRLTAFGDPLSISGSLTGTGAANHAVVLQASQFPFLGGFGNIGSPQTTNATGGFSFQVTGLSQNTQLRVATLDTVPAYSPVVSVRVAVRVTLHVHAKRNGFARFYGAVTPAEVGAPVAFQLLRPGRGPLTVGGTTARKGSAGSARFNGVAFIRHGLGGSYRAYVKITSGRHAPGYSRTVAVRSAPAPVRAHGRRHP